MRPTLKRLYGLHVNWLENGSPQASALPRPRDSPPTRQPFDPAVARNLVCTSSVFFWRLFLIRVKCVTNRELRTLTGMTGG